MANAEVAITITTDQLIAEMKESVRIWMRIRRANRACLKFQGKLSLNQMRHALEDIQTAKRLALWNIEAIRMLQEKDHHTTPTTSPEPSPSST